MAFLFPVDAVRVNRWVMEMTLLTLSEAAERLRVSPRTLEREAADGRIAVRMIRSVRVVEEAELSRYIAGLPCLSAGRETAGRSGSASVAASVLNAVSRLQLPEPTRGRSKLRSAGRRSTLRLVGTASTKP